MLYSKKVMEHFRHPHNYGRMKKPSGIGKVGNIICGDVLWLYIKVENGKLSDLKFETFGCLPPTEKLLANYGDWVSISDIKEGDVVLNAEGKRTTVKHLYKGGFKGELVRLVPFVSKFNSFYVTPTHPVLCVKRNFLKSSRRSSKECTWLRVNEEELISSKPYYVEAEYITPGDYIVFPKKKETKDNPKFSKDLMKLLGYYLSEGYLSANEHVLNFSFNKNEKENIREVKYLIKKITGKPGNHRIRNSVIEIYVCSKKWAKFFARVGNKYAKKKRLSNEVLLLPWKKQWEMVKTYIKGDGNIHKRRPKESATYRIDTTSKQLAIQIQEILTRGNIFASIKKFEKPSLYIEGRKVPPHTLFNISFKLKKKNRFVKENEDYFFVPVKRADRKPFSGMVYNLEVVGKNHSYLVKGFAVHNCAAALATSSVITDIAKGKTIEEALKISNHEVTKELGGLPAVKIHCSLLAVDALYEAIYDYLSKNGKPIPAGLEKKHERIRKDRENVEKRYKGMVGSERSDFEG